MDREEYARLWYQYCEDFSSHLRGSDAILALVGAGLSASSGIPTYQGSGATWKGHSVRHLSTNTVFERAPELVWEYYRDRQMNIMQASPNAGHISLSRLAQRKTNFLTITQNVDDLSQRAGHPLDTLVPIHGSMMKLCCTSDECSFLSETTEQCISLANPVGLGNGSNLPSCPVCQTPLRPSIVRFGDSLRHQDVDRIDRWLEMNDRIDLMLVVGCAASVSPAADYIDRAKEKGARVAVFNTCYEHQSICIGPEDWFFPGDASVVLPAFLDKV